jgi:hypothetical protein
MIKYSGKFFPSDFILPNWQTTIVIPTGSAPVECLVWAVLSLLVRSDISKINQIIVSINGPDIRTGKTDIQDKKEEFCSNLRKAGYPITVVRTWSRVGIGPAIQLAMPLVMTDNYLLMHDDVFVLNNDWQNEAQMWLQSDVCGIVMPPVLPVKLITTILSREGEDKSYATTITYLPTINTTFSIFKKSSNFTWADYHCSVSTPIDVSKINPFYEKKSKTYTILAGNGFANRIKKFTRLNIEKYKCEVKKVQFNCGSWPAYSIIQDNKIATFGNVAHHLNSMSCKEATQWEVQNPDHETVKLIHEIKESKFSSFYNYPLPEIVDISGFKPLVCVLVYHRIENITHWIKAWKECNHYNGRLLVVQNVDNTQVCKDIADQISELEPEYHWLRKNDNESLKHWFELLNVEDVDFDWNMLIAFTDDCIPLRKDFLYPFLETFAKNPKLGVVGGVPANFSRAEVLNEKYFLRSVAVAIKREVLEKVKEVAYKEAGEVTYKSDSYFSINCEQRIYKWAKDEGYEISETNRDWSLTYGWDNDNQGCNNLWEQSCFNIFGAKSGIYTFDKTYLKDGLITTSTAGLN